MELVCQTCHGKGYTETTAGRITCGACAPMTPPTYRDDRCPKHGPLSEDSDCPQCYGEKMAEETLATMTPPTGTGTPRTDAFAETMLGSPLEDGSGKRPVHPRAYREALKFCATLETALAAERARREAAERMIDAAQAVIDRWETPLWKDSEPTAGFIYELRNAVDKYRTLYHRGESNGG